LKRELELDKVLRMGSLPAVYFEPDFALHRLRSYIGTYIKEEIKEESLVRKIDRFARFLDLAGQLNSEPINHSKIAKTLKTTPNTIQEYFSILVDTLLCHRIDGWSHSVRKQLLQSPRYYWFDCGVLNALNGELETELKRSSFRYGKLFETLMIQEIVRFNDYFERDLRLYYWRDQNGKEIDLLLARNSSTPIAAIEFKSSDSPSDDDFSGFSPFHSEYPNVPRFCFSLCPRPYDLPSGVKVLPWREGLELIKRELTVAWGRSKA
jgi:predicted AAA+ superfamily ATPase